ncbi:MAG: sensor histidine kinase [Acidobacteriota bacterium]|nr:sensor histidine kinase [Acidobacteriota bacterium]
MKPRPSAESTGASIAARLHASQRELASRWLEALTEILPVEKRDVFPSAQLLDHIPELIAEIAQFLRAPRDEAIAANTAVMTKAAELGALRYEQRSSVHQLLREYHMLGTILEEFITLEVGRMGAGANAVDALDALSCVSQAVRVLQQQTVDTFVGKYAETIERQTNQLRGFTRLISHEIRQPLGVLQVLSRMLTAPDAQGQQLVATLERNVVRLGDVAGKLERLARLTRASDDNLPTEQEVELSALAADVAKQLEDMATTRNVAVDISDDLPTLVLDSGRIELALINLIANAIKYSDPEKPERYVRVRRVSGPVSAIVIEDNGIGIPEPKLVMIFEQFVRAHSDRDEELGAQGLGLGLAIVRECMEAMKGTVTVTSQDGVGTAFTLTWPVALMPVER